MTGSSSQHVVFTLGGQDYGMPIREVREILPMVAITPIPELPSTVLGVVNVRGVILPVMDIARKLHLPDIQPDEGTRILVVERPGGFFSFLADQVTEVLDLAADRDAERPADAHPPTHRAVTGVASGPNGLIVLLDPVKLLTDDEIAAIDDLIGG